VIERGRRIPECHQHKNEFLHRPSFLFLPRFRGALSLAPNGRPVFLYARFCPRLLGYRPCRHEPWHTGIVAEVAPEFIGRAVHLETLSGASRKSALSSRRVVATSFSSGA